MLENDNYYGKDLDLVNLYFNEISQYKLLTKDETIELFKKMKAGDENARNEIITHNLKLAASFAKCFVGRGIHILDLIEQANLGLIKAVDNFDYERDVMFSTYAKYWVMLFIYNSFPSELFNVNLTRGAYNKILIIKKYAEEFVTLNDREPNDEEIKKELCISQEYIDAYKCVINNKYNVSLDSTVCNDLDEEIPLIATIPSDEDVEEEIVDKINIEGFKDVLDKARISDRLRNIIYYRYGIGGGTYHSLRESGKHFNLSGERIRQLESIALKTLKRSRKIRKYYK